MGWAPIRMFTYLFDTRRTSVLHQNCSMFPYVNKETLFYGNTHPTKVEGATRNSESISFLPQLLWSADLMGLTGTKWPVRWST